MSIKNSYNTGTNLVNTKAKTVLPKEKKDEDDITIYGKWAPDKNLQNRGLPTAYTMPLAVDPNANATFNAPTGAQAFINVAPSGAASGRTAKASASSSGAPTGSGTGAGNITQPAASPDIGAGPSDVGGLTPAAEEKPATYDDLEYYAKMQKLINGQYDSSRAAYEKALENNMQAASVMREKLLKYLPVQARAQGYSDLGTMADSDLRAYNAYLNAAGAANAAYAQGMSEADLSRYQKLAALDASMHGEAREDKASEAERAWQKEVQNASQQHDKDMLDYQAALEDKTAQREALYSEIQSRIDSDDYSHDDVMKYLDANKANMDEGWYNYYKLAAESKMSAAEKELESKKDGMTEEEYAAEKEKLASQSVIEKYSMYKSYQAVGDEDILDNGTYKKEDFYKGAKIEHNDDTFTVAKTFVSGKAAEDFKDIISEMKSLGFSVAKGNILGNYDDKLHYLGVGNDGKLYFFVSFDNSATGGGYALLTL